MIPVLAATVIPTLLMALITWALYDADDADFTVDDYRPRPDELRLVSWSSRARREVTA